MIRFLDNPIVKLISLVLVVALSISVIRYGLYVDENGLIVLYREIYRGSHMFTDSWESYNLAGILVYPIFALYYQVLEPVIYPLGIGLVLYLRIVYLIIRGLIALYFYFVLRRSEFNKGAFWASLFYFMYVVAWKNISYKSLCDFGVILFITFLIRYFATKKQAYFIGMGLATCLAILSYPTMIVFPFVFGIILIVMILRGHNLLSGLITYIVTCFVCGGIYLVYIQMTAGILNAINNLPYLEDSAYDYPFIVRMGIMVGSYLGFAVMAFLMLLIVTLLKKIFNLREETGDCILAIMWAAFTVGICVMRIEGISIYRYTYALLIIFFWVLYYNLKSEKSDYTIIGACKITDFNFNEQLISICIVSAVVQLIWALSTNQGISVPALMAYYGGIVMILWIFEKRESLKLLVAFIIAAAGFFNFFCITEKNGGFYTPFDDRYYVEEGALKGVALLPDDYEQNELCYRLVNEYVEPESHLLVVFGTSSTAYLNSDAKMAIGSPYNRVHTNRRLLEFWECYPQHIADYVLIDKGNKNYDTFLESDCGKVIMSDYTQVVVEEGDFVLLSK